MTRALLVIDVQQEYFEGALPITHPVGHLNQILRVMDSANAAKIPTAVIRHHQADPESPIFRLNSDMWQLHPEVAGRPHDVLIDKQTRRLGRHFTKAIKLSFCEMPRALWRWKTRQGRCLPNNFTHPFLLLSRCLSAKSLPPKNG